MYAFSLIENAMQIVYDNSITKGDFLHVRRPHIDLLYYERRPIICLS